MRRKVLKLRKGSLKVVEEEIGRKKINFCERERFLRVFSAALELGFSISLPLVGGAIFGSYLDRVFKTAPKLTLSFLFLGLIVGILTIFRLIKD